jgi:hypothetical protein
MLDHGLLLGKLREFHDPDYAAFRGFPTTRAQARQEWAAAFAGYFDRVQEAIAPPVPGHPALDHGGVEGAFFTDLGLDTSISAAATAADFAGAWRQGVLAVAPGGSAVDGAGNAYVFIQWTNVPALHGALLGTLQALFEAPAGAAIPRLTEIAGAFHTASSGLIASVTITSSSSVSSPGQMGVL